MLNESPKREKKKKDLSHPNPWQLFYRTQWECYRRSVTVYLMYLFMSLLALACQAIPSQNNVAAIVLGIVCILCGAAFDAHLCYHFGRNHYGAFVAGELHRRNAVFGIKSGGDHRPEREYRPWKGFLIGFYTALPAVFFGILAGVFSVGRSWAYTNLALIMFAGWAILPITWFGTKGPDEPGLKVSGYWSLLMCLLPILVSGVAYIVGAYAERRARQKQAEHDCEIEEAGREAAEKMQERADIRAEKRKLSKKK